MSTRDPASYFNFALPTGPVAETTVLHPRFSRGAIAGLVLGLISLPAILIQIGLLTALAGIPCGIVGLLAVKRGGGRIKGGRLAITGLAFCVTAIVSWGVILWQAGKREAAYAKANRELVAAEMLLSRKGNQEHHGNSPAAKNLAAAYATTLKNQAAFSFSPEDNAISEVGVPTYCHLGKNNAAFILYIPFYRKLGPNMKGSLKSLIWATALRTAANHPELLPNGTKLAVAIRDERVYGSISTGEIGGPEAPATVSVDSALLTPFFQTPAR